MVRDQDFLSLNVGLMISGSDLPLCNYLGSSTLKKNINLNWLRSFEAVARHLSITDASKELGLTQTAVSLQLKSLEGKLGRNLFIRRGKGLTLTEIGKTYLPAVSDPLLALNQSTNNLFGPSLASTIVVRASMALTVWLSPKLAEFQAQYPGVNIKFVTAMWVDSRDTQPVDVHIVFIPDASASQDMEKLSIEFLIPIVGASSSGRIESAQDLIQVNPIYILGFDNYWPLYLEEFDVQHDARSGCLQVDTFAAACEFVSCNLGCAVIPERFAKNAIEMGRSIRYAGSRVPLDQSHYFAENKSAKETDPVVEAFKSWLRTLFAS
jgi:LysR family glycine cleavage system transcriptional activator